jgi:hypothetical protein
MRVVPLVVLCPGLGSNNRRQRQPLAACIAKQCQHTPSDIGDRIARFIRPPEPTPILSAVG